ncbi:MAG: hypothetical protein B7Y42_00615 [Polaromonas sp. 28-63-22]|nr:MAG: hypothetical protein B7Y42_00615 [Polaromonas sp. 28-63-22]
MTELRCGSCNRKLAMGCYSRLEIKCPRCCTMNISRASAADCSGPSADPARLRASSEKELKDDTKTRGSHAL